MLRHPFDFKKRGRGSSQVVYISSGPSVSAITETGAVVTWSVTAGATGQVFYGTTTAYGSSTTLESSYTFTTHVQSITGLTAGQTYHFKVVSVTATGYTVESADDTFTTDGALTGTYPTPAALAYSATASLALPAYLTPSTDANHGTEIVRISEADRDRNTYSSVAAWNCDETLCLINFSTNHEEVLNGQSLARLNANASILSTALSWSDTDPLTAWRTSSTNQILRLGFTMAGAVTQTGSWTLSAYSSIVLGGYQGQQAGDYIPLCYRKSSGMTGVAIWSISTQTIVSESDVGTGASPTSIANAILLSWDASYAFIHMTADGTGSTQGGWVADPTNLSTRHRITTGARHEDFVQLVNGHNALVMVAQRAAGGAAGSGSDEVIGYYDLDDGDSWHVLTGYYPGGHVSGRNLSRPGYVYVSNSMAYGASTYAGRQDVFAIELADPPASSGLVEYYAKQHAPDPKITYDSDPMACASPSGSRVIWGTGWDGSTTIHCFVAGVDAIL